MNEKILKDFLENKVYKRIYEQNKSTEIGLDDFLNMIVYARIDKKMGLKLIPVMEEFGLIEIISKQKFRLVKTFKTKPIEKRNF